MSDDRPVERLFGFLLIAVGGLFALLCGSCTLFFIGSGIVGMIHQPAPLGSIVSGLLLFLIVGGLPTAGGVVTAYYGWKIARGPKGR